MLSFRDKIVNYSRIYVASNFDQSDEGFCNESLIPLPLVTVRLFHYDTYH